MQAGLSKKVTRNRKFAGQANDSLKEKGFLKGNALAIVSVCREPVARTIFHEVAKLWGTPYDLSGPAGMPTGGLAAFEEIEAHAPQNFDRKRFIFYCFTHIGITKEGELGFYKPAGHKKPIPCCSYLSDLNSALQGALTAEHSNEEDLEMALFRRRMAEIIGDNKEITMPDLTLLTLKAIEKELEENIAATIGKKSENNYAVFTGTQIHAPTKNLVQPSLSYAVVGGARIDISVGANADQKLH